VWEYETVASLAATCFLTWADVVEQAMMMEVIGAERVQSNCIREARCDQIWGILAASSTHGSVVQARCCLLQWARFAKKRKARVIEARADRRHYEQYCRALWVWDSVSGGSLVLSCFANWLDLVQQSRLLEVIGSERSRVLHMRGVHVDKIAEVLVISRSHRAMMHAKCCFLAWVDIGRRELAAAAKRTHDHQYWRALIVWESNARATLALNCFATWLEALAQARLVEVIGAQKLQQTHSRGAHHDQIYGVTELARLCIRVLQARCCLLVWSHHAAEFKRRCGITARVSGRSLSAQRARPTSRTASPQFPIGKLGGDAAWFEEYGGSSR